MVLEQQRMMTAEEFREIASLPESEDKRLELDNGEIIEVAESRLLNSITGARLAAFLSLFVLSNSLGYVTGANASFELTPDTVRQPDVGFIAKDRLPEIPKRFEIPPDLAVEVVSPREDILRKATEYLRAGTKLVWAVYAEDQRVYVLHLDAEGKLIGQLLEIEDTLNGGDVLPGFTLPVRDIFP